MVNALYDIGRKGFLDGAIHWLSDDIKVVLVDIAEYTLDIALHDFLADIPVGARVATSGNLTDKTSTNGIADAGDVTFPTVTGAVSEAIVIYKDSGDPATSPLIAYIDDATGLPVSPNGGDITIQWDSGANKIFKL